MAISNSNTLVHISTATTTTGTAVSSYRQISLVGNAGLHIEMTINITATPLANQMVEFGLFPFGAGNAIPTEGIYFRYSTAGLVGISNFNASENSTAVLLTYDQIVANTNYVFQITTTERIVQFCQRYSKRF